VAAYCLVNSYDFVADISNAIFQLRQRVLVQWSINPDQEEQPDEWMSLMMN
jgi:hypothetical protein